MEEIKKETSPVEEAKQLLESINQANNEMKATIQKLQEERANALISGKSGAGQIPEQPKPETPKEYAQRIQQGYFKGDEGKHD